MSVRTDHIAGGEAGEFLAGPVPEDHFVLPVDDKGRDGRTLDNADDYLPFLDKLFFDGLSHAALPSFSSPCAP